MDDFSVFGCSFEECLQNLGVVLCRCVENNLVQIGRNSMLWFKKGLS